MSRRLTRPAVGGGPGIRDPLRPKPAVSRPNHTVARTEALLIPLVKHFEEHAQLILVTLGLLLFAAGSSAHLTVMKVSVDHLLAELGALLLIVGTLHFLFEMRLRREMLKEVAASVLGNQRLYDSGLSDCLMNSRQVDEREHWQRAETLTVGLQYSSRFFEDFHDVLKSRCAVGKRTTVLVLDPASAAAEYLRSTGTGWANVDEGVAKIRGLLTEMALVGGTTPTLLRHDRVLRYSFIRTEEAIWIKFFTNSKNRATVPAIRVRSNSPLYAFASADIDRLLEASKP
jgi:hypothetical protein